MQGTNPSACRQAPVGCRNGAPPVSSAPVHQQGTAQGTPWARVTKLQRVIALLTVALVSSLTRYPDPTLSSRPPARYWLLRRFSSAIAARSWAPLQLRCSIHRRSSGAHICNRQG